MFFKNGKLSGFIDFYWSKDDILINDLNSFFGMFCFDDKKELNYLTVRLIIDEYQKYRPLNNMERKYLYDSFELNYIWWASYILLNKKHQKKYSGRLIPELKVFKKFNKINREEFYQFLFNIIFQYYKPPPNSNRPRF